MPDTQLVTRRVLQDSPSGTVLTESGSLPDAPSLVTVDGITTFGSGVAGDPIRSSGTPGPIRLPVVVAPEGNFVAVAGKTNLIPPGQDGPVSVTFPSAADSGDGALLALSMFTAQVIAVDAIPGDGDKINDQGDGVPLNSETLETLWVSDGASNWWQISNFTSPPSPPRIPVDATVRTTNFTAQPDLIYQIDPNSVGAITVTLGKTAIDAGNGATVNLAMFPPGPSEGSITLVTDGSDTIGGEASPLAIALDGQSFSLQLVSDGESNWIPFIFNKLVSLS